MNWADKALIGITIVALLAVVVPISIGLAGEDDDLNVTGNFLLNSVYGQIDFGETSSQTISNFEQFTDMTPPPDDIVMTPPPDDIVMTPPPNNIFTGGDTPFNDYTFPPPTPEIEITTPVTGLMTLPEERIESFTFEKFQDGFTWEVDEDGFLFKVWDADRLGTNPEPKPEYPQVTENYTIEQNEDGTYTFATHSQYISDGYDWKPYILGQDESVVQIQIAGGTVVFDKVAGAVTIFNESESVIDSDSYSVRTALIGSDVWTSLDVNNADVETTVVEDGEKVTVSFIRENDEGKFTTEYVIYSGKVKTTVYFTNYIYENNKFAFTQTLNLPDNIISVNGMQDIDLNDYVGVSFDRATLEENEDLILEIKSIYYNSGLGFDNLWSVNVTTPTKVSLDYANVEQTQTAIGDTVELDPTYTLNKKGAMSPAQSTSSYGNSQGDSLGCGGRIASGTQGYNITWNLRNYVGSWNTWNGCRTAMVGFDLAGIPDSAIISDTKLVYDITSSSNAGTFDLNQMTQSGQDGWGLHNANTSQPVGTNPYSVYNTTNWDKTWEMYLDANNLGTQPNGAGSNYNYNLSPAVGTGIVTDLGSAGNADVMAQLKASTSVNGVADWFGIGMPYTAMKNGATAATNWTSQSVQTAYTQDMDFDNVNLLVTFYSPPSEPTNLTVTPNGSNVDLSWSESEIYSDYIVSSIAKNNYGTGIALPATWSLWQGGASPTTPTMGVGGVLGTAFDFNGSTDIVGENHVTGFPNSGVQPTQGSISLWIKPEATGASAGNPVGATGFASYWIQNGQWSSYYPLNSFNVGSLYSNGGVYNMQQWNHWVVAIDSTTSSNITTVYVNGSPVQMYDYPSGTGGGSANSSNSKTAGNLLANMQLGGQYHPNPQFKYPFEGKIDEFSSWNKVLSQSEVTTLYNSGNGNTPDSINSNDNLITYFPLDDTSAPLPNMAVTAQPSNYNVTYYVDRDGLSSAITTTNLSVTDTTTSFNTPYVYSLQAYNNAGGGSKWSESPYEVSSDAVLSDGTNNGATTGVGGVVGNAWSFAGTGLTAGADYVSGIDTELQDSSGNGYTMSMWFKPSVLNGDVNYVFEIFGAANFFNQFLLGDGSVYVTGAGASSANLVSNGSWHHLVTSVDSSDNATVYLNGSSIMTGSVPNWASQNQGELFIGARAPSNQYGFGGSIDEISVWDRNLSSSEVTSLYANGSPEPVNMQSWITGSDLTQYYNFEQTGNTLTNMAVTEDPSDYAITLTVDPPTNLSATVNAPNVDLSWSGGTGATGYKIESSTGTSTLNDISSFDTSTEVGYSTSTNTITKDVATGWGNSKIQSTQTFTVGEPFSFDFSPSNGSATGYIGLGQGTLEHNNGSNKADSMKFAYFIAGESKVYELSDTTAKYIQGGFSASDNYRIAVESDGTVKYYRQASGTGAFNLEYTSANTASGTYYVQSNMHTNGQGFIDIKANSLWTDVVANASPSPWTWDSANSFSIGVNGTEITKTSGAGWNSYIRTNQTITSGSGGSIAWTLPTATSNNYETGGFSQGGYTPNSTYSDFKYSIMFINSGQVQVWENNAHMGNFTITGFDPSTSVFKVDMDNTGTVTYWHNNELLHTSNTTASGTYYGHAALYTQNTKLLMLDESYSHTAPVQNSTNYYKVSTLIGSDASTANTATTALTATNYRTYIDNASSTSCVATGTIYEDNSRGNGVPSQGSGNRYCESTSMEYDISGIPDNATIIETDIDEIHNIWTPGWNPSCEYKANTTVQPSTGTGAQKYSATQTGTVYAYDQLCTTTAGTSYNVPLSAQASTDLQNQLSSDWFAISWTMDGFPVLSQTGSGQPSSVNSGSATLNVLHTAPASLAVGGVPDAPTGLTATFNNSTNDVDLSWTAPVNNNGSAVTGYKIETSLDNGATWSPVITTTNTNTIYSHVSPTLGVINYYQISAVNVYGAGDSSVSFVTPSVDTTITLPAGTYPSGVATDSSGNTYVSLSNLNQIAVYDSSGTLQNTYGAGGAISCTNSAVNFGNPQGIAVDSSGDIWVAEHSCHRVQKLDSSGNHLFYMGNTPTGAQGYTTAGFSYPYDVDFDTSGNLFVVDAGNEQISKFDSSGNFISQFLSLPSTGQGNYEAIGLWAIAIDSDDDVYIADRYNHRVSHYDSSGTYIDSIGTSGTGGSTNSLLNNPQGVDVDADNNLYIADTNNQRVQKFDSSGTYVTSTPASSNYYNSVAIDNSYNIHVVSDERNAEIYGQTSVTGTMAGGPPDAPTNLTLNYSVPNVDLTWVAPTNTNGQPVIGYRIDTSIDGSQWNLLAVTTNTNVTYPHTNPTAGSDNYYKVSAINSIGTSVPGNTANIFVGTPPDAPTGLTVTPLAGAQHTIDWVAPAYNGGLAITNYEIERSPTGVAGTWATVQQVGNVLTWTDNTGALTLGDTYYYQVMATNSLGNSPASNVGSGLTGDKPSAVTNVTSDALVNYEINVNWAPANENFYALTTYEIFASENGGTPVSQGTVPQAQTTFLDQGLNTGSTYTYSVYATNSLGTSTVSNTSSTVAGDAPATPTGLSVTPVVPSQIDIAWTASPANGYTTTYTVAVSTDSGSTWDETSNTGLTATALTKNGLVNGQIYQYKISATNTLGTSAYTADVSGKAGDVPAQPVGISVTTISATELTFAWGIPGDNGYNITGYIVERSDDNFATSSILNANYQNNTYSDSGLTASTAYYYRVSAINGLGTGPVSGTGTASTYGVPSAVSTLSLTTISTSQIDLTWSQPALNGYLLVDYAIERSFDGLVWQPHATTTNTTYQDTLNTNTNTEYHYRIITQNAYGLSVPGNAEIAYTLPTPPAAITPTVQSDVQVDLVWNNPAGAAHTGFLIEQSDDSGATWTPVITTTNQNLSYNILGLTPLTDYQFRASTVNPAGTSSPSPVGTATTFGHPGVPTTLTATALPGSQIKLDWVAPTVLNGSPVTEYKIERSTDGGATWGPLVANTGNLLLTHTDTGLTTTQEYHYRISAYNIYGVGSPGNESSAIASDVPSQVTGLVATPTINYTIDLSWTAPNGNGYPVIGYVIERNIASAGWLTIVSDTASTATTFADINLSASTVYEYRVSAINIVGTGNPSAIISSNAGDVPDSPVLTLTALPSNTIQLDWTTPTDNGFSISTYAIEKSIDNQNWSPLTSINANTTQDTGLTNSTTYYYKVTAVNQVGNSVFSSSVSMIAGDTPGTPNPLTATTTTNTSIDLSWATPNPNGYAVTGYKIERSIDGGATWTPHVPDTQSLSIGYADTGLTNGVTYSYQVSAINQLGTGSPSSVATAFAGNVPDASVLTSTALPNSIIQLDWTAPNDNGFVITSYQVDKSIDGGSTWTPLVSGILNTTQDTGLTNGLSYQYRVTSTNIVGTSAYSNIETIVAGDTPSSITSLTATTQSDTSIVLTWPAAGNNGYAITGYQIEQSPDGAAWTTIVPDTQNTSLTHTVSGLTDRTDYYFKVTGINTLGIGALGPVASAHTFGIPDAFVALTFSSTDTSATVNWVQPYDHGSAITSYRVEILNLVNGVGNSQWLTLTSLSPTVLTNTHNGLQSNTEYQYRIVATNPYGSVTSAVQPITTLALPPVLTATPSSGSTIDLTWSAVSGSITYNIYSSSDNITFLPEQTGITTTTYQDTSLTSGQTLYYTISVTNISGEGSQSASVSATTHSLPGAPTGLTMTNPTPITSSFTWIAPSNNGGDPNLTYTLQRSEDNTIWNPGTSWSSNYATDTSLNLGTQYYWRVNSVTSAGISSYSNVVNYLTPELPTAPASLTAVLTGATNSASVLNWGAPSNTSGYSVIGYHIERNEPSTGWITLVADTGNAGTIYTNTGLVAGTNYIYRVSAITAVGEGPASNTASVQPVLAVLTISGTPTGGNSVSVTASLSVTGSTSSTIVQQALYKNNARVDHQAISVPLTNGASLLTMNDYPTQTSSFFMTITLDTGYVIQSNSINLTPSAPFTTGDISFSEDRTEYNSPGECSAAGGLWAPPSNPLSNSAAVCDLSYTESVLAFTVQPSGADVIISYQPQNLNEPAIIKSFTATSSQISETTTLDAETDYYGSIIVNPTFDYTTDGAGNITVVCDAGDIMCETDAIPKGTPSEKTFKSFKSPDATRQLGIEPMGDLFGVNMVFIFVIALAGIFTGRSAPMGVIFIIVTLGVMAYLGYLDFGSDELNAATWALLIISAILGIFLGKRFA